MPWLLLVLIAGGVLGVGSASAALISPESLGVNVSPGLVNGRLGPSDLSVASAAGLGVARVQVIEGNSSDPVIALTAAAHLRLYPLMGLRCPSGSSSSCPVSASWAPSTAASKMAKYMTSFAQRYGRGGSFWSEHPQLPYLPVTSYEIGNEPNIPLQWVADSTHLHWSDPSAYARVYEAGRAALHRVDPRGMAVVGGLADSATLGVDIQHDERWLAALTPGTVDAVGYHPYTFDISNSLMFSDTQALRRWMDANGLSRAPLDVNEVGACDVTAQTTNNYICPAKIRQRSADWGAVAAYYARWALCTPALHVESIQPEYWGAMPGTDQNTILALVSSALTFTPYGRDYLGLAHSLTTQGCPVVRPTRLSSMRLRVSVIHRSGRHVEVTVRAIPRSGRVLATAAQGPRHRVILRVAHRDRNRSSVTLTAKLTPGHWTLTISAVPAHGYATPKPVRRRVTIPR